MSEEFEPEEEIGKRPRGRPHSLEPDERTIKIVEGLGRIQATVEEIARVLNVTKKTYISFKKRHPIIEDAYQTGRAMGRVSLRRAQFRNAENGNTTMQIWLGKQYLEQSDHQNVNSNVTFSESAGSGAMLAEMIRRSAEARRISSGGASGGESADTDDDHETDDHETGDEG